MLAPIECEARPLFNPFHAAGPILHIVSHRQLAIPDGEHIEQIDRDRLEALLGGG
jgi:hypothetical protein